MRDSSWKRGHGDWPTDPEGSDMGKTWGERQGAVVAGNQGLHAEPRRGAARVAFRPHHREPGFFLSRCQTSHALRDEITR
jgi:hypothetical protein